MSAILLNGSGKNGKTVIYLADSNILIYAAIAGYESATAFISDNLPAVSIISKIEVLGFSGLKPADIANFENIFSLLKTIPLSDSIVEKTIKIKKLRKIKLAVAIIAATAIDNNMTLVTRNTADFNNIPELLMVNIIDPKE